jgi:hypothetical protein
MGERNRDLLALGEELESYEHCAPPQHPLTRARPLRHLHFSVFAESGGRPISRAEASFNAIVIGLPRVSQNSVFRRDAKHTHLGIGWAFWPPSWCFPVHNSEASPPSCDTSACR